MAEFRKCKRDAKLLLSPEWKEWRLASVDEVSDNLPKIKELGILNSWDTARLLNGCITGKYSAVKQYRPNVEDMLLIKTDVSRHPDGSFPKEMYFGVKSTKEGKDSGVRLPKGGKGSGVRSPKGGKGSGVKSPKGGKGSGVKSTKDGGKDLRVTWTRQGGIAAILLSCEDKITEAICFVLQGIVDNEKVEGQRVEELRKLTEYLQKKFRNRRTVLHYAVDQPLNKKHGEYVAQLLKDEFKGDKNLIKAADIYGRTALHFAAFHGNIEVCRILIEECHMSVDETDINKENSLHFALKDKQTKVFNYLCKLPQVQSIIGSPDAQGRTALHKAAAQGSKEMITTLLSTIGKSKELEVIRQPDLFGQTALLEAARTGHVEAVELLLERGSRPLHERNSDGRSALHYAVQLSRQNEAEKMARLLLNHYKTEKEKSLLLWASATGSGTAEETSPKSSQVHSYLKTERERIARSSEDLLSTAIELGYENMTWELVKRGADTTRTDHIAKLSCRCEKQQCAKNLIEQLYKIEKMPEQGRDQPAIYDSLGRKEFAEGLAALFLNPYEKSPITVGISGDWGMGKSSLMFQTEIILLKTAAQLAFPSLLATEQFPGCRQIEQTPEGRRKYEEMNKAVRSLLLSSASKICPHDNDYALLHFLKGDYQEEHRDVYKSLAVMDRSKMFEVKVKGEATDSSGNQHPLSKIPSILTVRYNAWHYQNQSEAWAGLAVETTKAIEEAMTTAQRVRCHCRYAWRKQRNTIWLELFLPCLFVLFLSGWLAWVLWKLFSKSKNNELVQLTYGSIPITILVVIWTVMRQFLSVIKPVSAQIMGYFSKPDHTTKLGYQHQVIFDIKFLKKELAEKPSRTWKFFGWLCNLLHVYPDNSDNVKGTSVSKSPAPGEDRIRMIVFVDDLDRCEDTVILKVLSAVNLVLVDCNINVILGMDEKMIAKAMKYQFPDSVEDPEQLKELTKKYLSKIVQLPLALPDTSEDETKKFLREQLGEAFVSMSQNAEAKVREQPSTEEIACDNQSLAGQSPAHVCLEVRDNVTQKSQVFFSKLSKICKPFAMLKNYLEWGPEEKKKIMKKTELVTTSLNFQRFMRNYSDEERKALDDLSEAATGERRLPREWKRFLTYHRVAWNILSQSETVKKNPGWQMQLVVWLFCCWQWEDQINDIIKDWKRLVPVNAFLVDSEDCLESNKPSLNYMIEYHRPPREEEENGEGKKTEEDTQNNNNQMSNGQNSRDEQEQKQKSEKNKEEEEKEKKRENWYSLKKMLDTERKERNTYDVSLDCILSFQKFRLYCDIGHLSSPKRNGNKNDKGVQQRHATSTTGNIEC